MNISSTTSSAFSAMQRPDATALFKKTDADSDGKITKEELATELEERAQKTGSTDGGPSADDLFEKLDGDGDGVITEEEHATGLEQMERERPDGPPPGGGFEDSEDLLQSMLEKLAEETSEETAALSEDDRTKLVQQLAEQLKQSGQSASLFKASA